MPDLQVTNTFVDGDTVSAANFNTNYAAIVTYVNERNSASTPWEAMYATHGTNVPLTANNSTGVQDIVQMKDNGTNVFQIPDGGIVNMPYQDFAYSLWNSSVEIYSSGAPRLLSFYSVQSQTQSSMDSSGKFTAEASGKYLISAIAQVQGLLSTHVFGLYLYKNGSVVTKNFDVVYNTVSRSVCVADIVSLSAGDYVQIYAEDGVESFAVGNESNRFTTIHISKLS